MTKPGQDLTRQPGPRVLIETGFDGTRCDDLVERLAQTVPTVRAVQYASHVNLNEWDCLVSWGKPNSEVEFRPREDESNHDSQPVMEFAWKQQYPPHLSLICIVDPYGDADILDVWPEEGTSDTLPPVSVLGHSGLLGEHIRTVDGLPDGLATLVRADLVPAVQQRGSHTYFESYIDEQENAENSAGHLILRPFLLGPDDQPLAGTYTRNDNASAWLLPSDIPDPYPWIREALREWQTLYRLIGDWGG